jgi:hypothetical protein
MLRQLRLGGRKERLCGGKQEEEQQKNLLEEFEIEQAEKAEKAEQEANQASGGA